MGQVETEEETVWTPVMGEARAVKQSYARRWRLPVFTVLGMAAAVFLVVALSRQGQSTISADDDPYVEDDPDTETLLSLAQLPVSSATPRTIIGPNVCTHATRRPCRSMTNKEAIGVAIQLERVTLPFTVSIIQRVMKTRQWWNRGSRIVPTLASRAPRPNVVLGRAINATRKMELGQAVCLLASPRKRMVASLRSQRCKKACHCRIPHLIGGQLSRKRIQGHGLVSACRYQKHRHI